MRIATAWVLASILVSPLIAQKEPVHWVNTVIDMDRDLFVASGSLIKGVTLRTHGHVLTIESAHYRDFSPSNKITCMGNFSFYLDHESDIRTTDGRSSKEFIESIKIVTPGWQRYCKDTQMNSFLAFSVHLFAIPQIPDCQQ